MGIYNNSLQKRLESLQAAPISDVNKKLISNFVDHCFTERLNQHRVLKYISALKVIALKIQLDFDKIEKKDLFVFISDLERSNSSQWLKHDYNVTLKKFSNGTSKKTILNLQNGLRANPKNAVICWNCITRYFYFSDWL